MEERGGKEGEGEEENEEEEGCQHKLCRCQQEELTV